MSQRTEQHGRTIYRVYDSIEDLIQTAEKVPFDRYREHDHATKSSWIGRKFSGWAEVFQAARSTWKNGLKIVDQMLRDLDGTPMPKPTSRRRRTRFAEDNGDELDYDRMRSGQSYWRTSRRENTRGPATITVVVDIAAHCGVKHRDILWRGAAAIALAVRLEAAGYRVELWSCDFSSNCLADPNYGAGMNTHVLEAVCLKRPGDPLDASTLVSAISGWFFRTVNFRSFCQGTWAIHHGLGQPRIPTAEDLNRITPDQNRLHITKTFSYGSAVELIRAKLIELTSNCN